MALAVTFLCCLALQQLAAAPFPAEVGQPVTVRAERLERPAGGGSDDGVLRPIASLSITVEMPDGTRAVLGPTDAAGIVHFVPSQAGTHVYSAEVGGVRLVAPHRVVAARARWLPALVCVPLGLALLWQNLRRRRSAVEPGAVSG